METKIVSRFDYPEYNGEINSGELLVEPAGYIPADVKIESMINAGQRLIDARAGYEFQNGEVIPDDYYDPTRQPGFDLADASRLQAAAAARIRAKKNAPVETTGEKIPEPAVPEMNPKT